MSFAENLAEKSAERTLVPAIRDLVEQTQFMLKSLRELRRATNPNPALLEEAERHVTQALGALDEFLA